MTGLTLVITDNIGPITLLIKMKYIRQKEGYIYRGHLSAREHVNAGKTIKCITYYDKTLNKSHPKRFLRVVQFSVCHKLCIELNLKVRLYNFCGVMQSLSLSLSLS